MLTQMVIQMVICFLPDKFVVFKNRIRKMALPVEGYVVSTFIQHSRGEIRCHFRSLQIVITNGRFQHVLALKYGQLATLPQLFRLLHENAYNLEALVRNK